MKTFFKVLAVALIIVNVSCKQQATNNEATDTSKLENRFDNKGAVVHLNDATFKDLVMDYSANPKAWVFKGQKPCIVDFYATWCPPCKRLAPILEELAKEYTGKINIYKVDVDLAKESSAYFNIESIPALIFSPVKGKPVFQAGAMSKEDLKKIIDEMLVTNKQDTTKIN